MRFRVLSDLHFEFQNDGGAAFMRSLNVEPDEALLCAGDLTSGHRVGPALDMLCAAFRHVFYVVGNHEFYGSSLFEVHRAVATASIQHENFHALDYDEPVAHVDGVRVVGCPLWFVRDDGAPRHCMNDFRLIRDFDSWVYEENRRCVEFLRREVRPGDVVVTHYLPSFRSVAPRFRGSPLNAFFVCDVESVIAEAQPALWIHGHTHDSIDYRIGATRVLCNPFGYASHEENPAFDSMLRVEVQARP